MRQLLKIVCLLLGAMFLVAAPSAWALEEDASEIGQLTNRYESLKSLENSSDTTDSVVTDTRVGVLTSVNKALDGVTVRFTGEAVGDIVSGGNGYKWVNVLGSDGSCIGVYMKNADAKRVLNVGDYATTGSTLQIRGIYHVACSDHQGELDVHLVDMQVLDAGGSVQHMYNKKDVLVGVSLCGVGLVLLLVFFIGRHFFNRRKLKEERERRNRGASISKNNQTRKVANASPFERLRRR